MRRGGWCPVWGAGTQRVSWGREPLLPTPGQDCCPWPGISSPGTSTAFQLEQEGETAGVWSWGQEPSGHSQAATAKAQPPRQGSLGPS